MDMACCCEVSVARREGSMARRASGQSPRDHLDVLTQVATSEGHSVQVSEQWDCPLLGNRSYAHGREADELKGAVT